MTDHPDDDLYLRGDPVSRRRDVLRVRGDRLMCVRHTKTKQPFVPHTMITSILPWDLVFGIIFSMARAVPTWFSREWQVGVFWVPNVKEPGARNYVLVNRVFDDFDAAAAFHAELLTQVMNGDFDTAEALPTKGRTRRFFRRLAGNK